MSYRYTLTPYAANELVKELLTSQRPQDIDVKWSHFPHDKVTLNAGVKEVWRYDPDEVYAYCRQFQPDGITCCMDLWERAEELLEHYRSEPGIDPVDTVSAEAEYEAERAAIARGAVIDVLAELLWRAGHDRPTA